MPPPPTASDVRPRVDDRTRRLLVAIALVLLVGWAGWMAGRRSAEPGTRVATLVVYGYSAVGDAVTHDLAPAFRDRWREATGEHVEFVTVFAGSGAITRSVLGAVQPQVAIVGSALDALRLEQAPRTRACWRDLPHEGVLCRTPLLIRVRSGNPHRIVSYADLARGDLDVLLSDPSTSALGVWSVLAIDDALREPGHPAPPTSTSLERLWDNVGEMPASAREATRLFEDGEADAWISYESQLVTTPTRTEASQDVVRPPEGEIVVAEPVVVRLDANIVPQRAALVDAFLAFLWSAEGQRLLVRHGFHTVLPDLDGVRADLPPLSGARTLDALGGPAAAGGRVRRLVPADRMRAGGP